MKVKTIKHSKWNSQEYLKVTKGPKLIEFVIDTGLTRACKLTWGVVSDNTAHVRE